MAHLTIKQIKQLIEIDNAGEGIRAEVQGLIARLISGSIGGSKLDRVVQAQCLWDKGFGQSFDSFEAYLATIPEIPEKLMTNDERFPLLVLVDARLGVQKSCEFAGLRFDGGDEAIIDFYPKRGRTSKVYWMRCQDGRKNQGRSIKNCRKNLASDELGLTAIEGIALYIQNVKVIREHYLELAGSVLCGGQRRRTHEVVYLGRCWPGESGLRLIYHDAVESNYGTASRLK